jgi:hypothetical protein
MNTVKDNERCGALRIWLNLIGKKSESVIFHQISSEFPVFADSDFTGLNAEFHGLVKEVYDLHYPIYLKKLSREDAMSGLHQKHVWLDEITLHKLWGYGEWCFDKG